MAVKYDCWACKKQVTATKNQRYRSHSDGTGEPCEQSSEPIPEHILAQPVGQGDDPSVPREGVDFARCPQCDRNVKLTRMGYFEPHDTTLKGGDRCEVSGVRHKHARRTEDVPLPGDEKPRPSAAIPEVRAQDEVKQPQAVIILPARTSASAGAGSTPLALPPSDGGRTEPSSPSSGRNWSDEQFAAAITARENPGVGAPAPSTAIRTTSVAAQDAPVHEVNLARDPMGSPESTSMSSGSKQPDPVPPTSSDAPSSEPDDATAPEADGPWPMAPGFVAHLLQPFSPFQQPGEIPVRLTVKTAMSDRGKEIAARLREIFYAYTNRNSSDNRSAQKRMGPSEAGSPCDRQIAMKLLGVTPVNPQEGWAPFVGTAVHVELAKMFDWANGSGSGRYVTEMRVNLPSEYVPRGTLDVIDRVLYLVGDHKLMGRYSLDKLIQEGPSETYLVQGQIYGLGAVLAGERVREIAIIGWPRQESTLDKLYVHVMPFDRKVAEAALARVDRIAQDVKGLNQPAVAESVMDVARQFPAGDDCKWCPFHLKGDKNMERGCPGK